MKSLNRYTVAYVIGVLIPVSALIGIQLTHSWHAHTAARDARSSLCVVQGTLDAMAAVLMERGSMNAALIEGQPVSEARQQELQLARSASDGRIAELLALHQTRNCDGCRDAQGTIQHIARTLVQHRALADRLIARRRTLISAEELNDVVVIMAGLIPALEETALDNSAVVIRHEVESPGLMTIALLAAGLREQAGLLGSAFMPAQVQRRPLSDEETQRIEQQLGRVAQLRALLEVQLSTHADLETRAYPRVQYEYFGAGLEYIAALRHAPPALAHSPPHEAGMQERYVPLMQSILDFRDEVLNVLQKLLERQRVNALTELVTTTTVAIVLLLAATWGFTKFRWRLIRPFVVATEIINSLNDNAPAPISAAGYRKEVRGLFDAIQTLKDNAIAKSRTEHERERLIADLAALAETDFLTGLLNRRAFHARAEALCASLDEPGQMLTLIVFDIDHFKRINDSYGHAGGDNVLVAVAQACHQTWRRSDIVARIGGEEFAVLCTVRSTAQASAMAQSMRRRVERLSVPLDGKTIESITSSFGVVCAPADEIHDIDALLKQADELLYRAKASGRNCVITQSEDA
ncbi:diguanylate cyclase, GGDEF domain protein 2 [Achromobacter xylosoxidans A8]|uniref:diguanylate cyclase n=1 Tax=Achromobacter xylosoxidans (strain A8) TaxID=762376 RepID=E3HGH1_ACHXA|nr:GGDEF domain-containing protein [Achromobacter xylosoxidans]ADP14171.1 diguanylate cyclase, GGDEF domain protein 2 [Achromobacter xylosoxidans A8]